MTILEIPDMSVDDRPFSEAWYLAMRRLLGESICRQLGIYAIPEDFVLSVVIPVYNEEKTLRDLVVRVAAVPIRKEIILVDDCSRDHSLDVMQAISLAGGTTPYASVNDIVILRRQNGHQQSFKFHYSEVARGRDLAQNIQLQSGDTVVVP